MSIHLLNNLKTAKIDLFNTYVSSLNNYENMKIAWYPSAGSDFRALLYLSKEYEQQNKIENKSIETPGLFIFTDYGRSGSFNPLEKSTLFSDENTTIKTIACEELDKFDLPLHEGIIDHREPHENTRKVFFMLVQVESNELGTYKIPMVYAFVENEAFAAEVLLPNEAKISHVIHVRYGGGCGGGGKARGSWIPTVLDKLGTDIFITDNRHEIGEGDKKAIEIYPHLDGDYDTDKLKELRKIDAALWSNYGDVSWYEVIK